MSPELRSVARDWKTAYAEMHARGEAEFPPAGLHYLLEIIRNSARERGEKHLASGEFSEYFRKRIRNDFGPLTNSVLREWGLAHPKDLGRALNLLGRHGCLKLDDSDTPESFAMDSRTFLE